MLSFVVRVQERFTSDDSSMKDILYSICAGVTAQQSAPLLQSLPGGLLQSSGGFDLQFSESFPDLNLSSIVRVIF